MICECCKAEGFDKYFTFTGKNVADDAKFHVLLGSLDCNSIVYEKMCTFHVKSYDKMISMKTVTDKCRPTSHSFHVMEVKPIAELSD